MIKRWVWDGQTQSDEADRNSAPSPDPSPKTHGKNVEPEKQNATMKSEPKSTTADPESWQPMKQSRDPHQFERGSRGAVTC